MQPRIRIERPTDARRVEARGESVMNDRNVQRHGATEYCATTLDFVQHLLVTEFGVASNVVAPAANLSSFGLDSLQTIEFLFRVEEHFDLVLAIDPSAVETLEDVVRAIDDTRRSDPDRQS